MKKVLYLFGPLDDADVDWMIQQGTSELFDPGKEIVRQGAHNDAVFVLLEGSATVSTTSGGEVTTLGWGEVIGEMSLVDGRPASATVTAKEACRALRVPRTTLETKLERDPKFASRFYRGVAITVSERLRSTMSGDASLDELSSNLLDSVSSAGNRFDRILKAKLRQNPS